MDEILTALTAVIDGELLLSDAELDLLLQAMRRDAARHIFAFLRESELALAGYAPAKRAVESVYGELCVLFACAEFANQVLTYYVDAESRHFTFDGAENDEKLKKVAAILRGMSVAPLIAEFPEAAAFTLWTRAGSWTGAMTLCGLKLLTEETGLRAALERYAVSRAATDLLTEPTLNSIPDSAKSKLSELCEILRVRGEYPGWNDVAKLRSELQRAGVSLKSALGEIGLQMKKKRGGKKPKDDPDHTRKIQNFNAAATWRRSPEYLAMQRAGGKNKLQAQNAELQSSDAQETEPDIAESNHEPIET